MLAVFVPVEQTVSAVQWDVHGGAAAQLETAPSVKLLAGIPCPYRESASVQGDTIAHKLQ